MERTGPPPRLFGLIGWSIVALVFVGVIVYGLSVYLDWIVLQSMYASKAGSTGSRLTSTTITPSSSPVSLHFSSSTHSLGGVISSRDLQRSEEPSRARGQEEAVSLGPGKVAWFLWQVVKWAIAFWMIATVNGIPGLGNMTIVITMLQSGLGNWGQVVRVFQLPLAPASGTELVALMPTMEVQYRLIYDDRRCGRIRCGPQTHPDARPRFRSTQDECLDERSIPHSRSSCAGGDC